MSEKLEKESIFCYIVIAAFAMFFFVTIYGVEVLDFGNVDWLYGRYEVKKNCFYGNDLTQHYLGWQCYRQSEWTFPVGNMDRFSYPFETSVIYTDSIPIFALFFKILSPILPEEFQYFGLWAILCFILQGIMAVRLFKTYTKDPVKLVLAATFFVIVPMLVWRTFIHSALCAHWVILMAMEPLVSKEQWNRKKLVIHYATIGFLASMIAIYLLLFCGIVLLGMCIRDLIERKSALNSLFMLLSFVITAAFFIAVMGGFSSDLQSSLNGLGRYSMNLNSLFDSYGLSMFFQELPRLNVEGDCQFEGYGYLGLGIYILCIIVCIYVVRKRKNVGIYVKNNKMIVIGVIVSVAIAVVYAVSPNISLNDRLLFTIPVPHIIEEIWSIFRATGRGVWILVYTIMFILMLLVITIRNRRVSYLILGGCLIVQLIDSIPMYESVYGYFHNTIPSHYMYENMTHSLDFWNEIASDSDINNVVLATTYYPYDDETTYYYDGVYHSDIGPESEFLLGCQYLLGDFAIRNNKTFNYFRFSRHPYERSREYVLGRLKNPTSEDLFVFTEYNKFQGFASGLNMYKVDDLYVGVTKTLLAEYGTENADKVNKYSFDFGPNTTKPVNFYRLSVDETINCFMMELPKGIYRFSIVASEPESVELSLAGDEIDELSLLWYNVDDDNTASYYIYINGDLYTAYTVISNISELSVDLYSLEVEYIGSDELLNE